MKRFLALFCLFILNISLSHADVTIDIIESGGDVIATASGTLSPDQTGFQTDTSTGGLVSGNGFDEFQNSKLHIGTARDIVIHSADSDNAIFNNIASLTAADSNTGNHIGLISSKPGFSDRFSIDRANFGSGEPRLIDATSTWNSTTLATLGFIEGTYVFSANVSTITLNIGSVDSTDPTLLSSTPADNATGVSTDPPTLSLVFDEPVSYASGIISMHRTSDDSQVNSRSVSGSIGSGTPNISIGFEGALAIDTEYYVLIPAGGFEDAAGNPYAGIDSTTALSFSTGVPSTPTYSVGGTIAGKSGSVTLQNNGGDDIIKDAFDNSDFTFPAQAEGSSYSVSVSSQPFGQTCTVTNGSGTIGSADVTNVSVTCEDTRLLGGFMIGVVSGGSITLQNNGADDFTWLENPITSYRFPTRVPVGATWNVTVLTPPTGQTCTVSNAVGTMGNSNFTDVDVTCVTDVVPTYSVGGTVSGLSGTGLALQNNGGDTLAVAAAATDFTFAMELLDLATYAVTVSTQPTGQTCEVTNGSGVIAAADVTDVAVVCVDNPTYPVTVSVTGVNDTGNPDDYVELQNNGTDTITVVSNGTFSFPTELQDSAPYDVTVSFQPETQTCTVTNGTGTVAGAPVIGPAVSCVDDVVPPVEPPIPATPIPTMSQWALVLLAMLLGLMVFSNRKRLF